MFGKGVSEYVAVLLLMIISLALAGLIYIFYQSNINTIYPGEQIGEKYASTRSCLSIDELNAAAGTALMRNCGQVPLSSFALYIDDVKETVSLPQTLQPNEKFNIAFRPLSAGKHVIYISSDKTSSAIMRITI